MARRDCDVSVVIITKDRCASVQRTLAHMLALPEQPEIIVVDNGSNDGTADALARLAVRHPQLRVVALPVNRGAAARNIGVAAASNDVIAFCDDDSWWEPGALPRAGQLLGRHLDVAVLVAAVRLVPDGALDRVSQKMSAARLGRVPGDPGPQVLSFPAFAAVVRRKVFDEAGGFSRLLFFGGEERLFALDVATAGHRLCYVNELVTWHVAESGRMAPRRWALHERNDRLIDWMRRPLPVALAGTARLAVRAARDRHAARAMAGLIVRLPGALLARRPVPADVDLALRAEDRPLQHRAGSAS